MNRRPYNRSAFNRPSAATSSVTGLALLKMGASPVAYTRTISAIGNAASLDLSAAAVPTNAKRGAGNTALVLSTQGVSTKVLCGLLAAAVMALKTSADQSIQGEAIIDLTGLVLAPGDELTINTEDMTVTLDGQNGMDYFSLDSEFFTLLSGLNTLVFTDGETARTVAFDIIWKDRWL